MRLDTIKMVNGKAYRLDEYKGYILTAVGTGFTALLEGLVQENLEVPPPALGWIALATISSGAPVPRAVETPLIRVTVTSGTATFHLQKLDRIVRPDIIKMVNGKSYRVDEYESYILSATGAGFTATLEGQVQVDLELAPSALEWITLAALTDGTPRTRVAETPLIRVNLTSGSADFHLQKLVHRSPDIRVSLGDESTAQLISTSALSAYMGKALSAVVADLTRGGTFARVAKGALVANGGTLFTHSDTIYLWQRVAPPGIVFVDWFIDGSSNHAPLVQAALDATPTNGTLVFGRKTGFYNLASWTRPDGRACLLYRSKPIVIEAQGNEYGGYMSFDSSVPNTTDIFLVSSSVFADTAQGTYFGYKFTGLSIIPGAGSSAAQAGRHIINLQLDAANGLAHVDFENCQFVTANNLARAVFSVNTLNANGLYASRLLRSVFRGGVRLGKLGDSVSIRDCVSYGPNIGFEVDMLTPTDVGGASAMFTLSSSNVTNFGGAIKLSNAATFHISTLNGEFLSNAETGGGNGKALIALVDCGTLESTFGTKIFSGSTLETCKVNPTDGNTYLSSSGAYGLTMVRCRSVHIHGGSYGNGQVRDSSTNAITANSYSIYMEDCDGCSVDVVDVQLTSNSVGVAIVGAASKNNRVGHVVYNQIPATSATQVQDFAPGTLGVRKTLTLATGWTDVSASTEKGTFVKQPDLTVRVQAAVAKTSGAIAAFETLTTLPTGFVPALNTVRFVGVLLSTGVYRTAAARVVGVGNGAATGAVQILEAVASVTAVYLDFAFPAPLA